VVIVKQMQPSLTWLVLTLLLQREISPVIGS
jgi:hypothetical protein